MGRASKSIPKSSQKAVNGGARSTALQVGFLPKEAYTVLRSAYSNRLITVNSIDMMCNPSAYYVQVTRHPSKVQYDDLVTKIRRVPGCEDCKPRKLRAYFKEKRKTEARARLAVENKARSHAKPGTSARLVNVGKLSSDLMGYSIVEIIKTAGDLPPPSQLPILPAESDPPPPHLPLPSSHLYPTFRSNSTHIPTTFIDLTQWLQEQNTRFKDLAPAEGLR